MKWCIFNLVAGAANVALWFTVHGIDMNLFVGGFSIGVGLTGIIERASRVRRLE